MGYISNFLDDTIKEINSITYNKVNLSEDDVLYVEVGDRVITWECFKNSAKGLDWDSSWGVNYIRQDITIYLKYNIILILEEYDSNLYWYDIRLVNSKPDESIMFVQLRPDNYEED